MFLLLACVSEPVPRNVAAAVHRMTGLRGFVDRDPDRSTKAFAAGRYLEPAYKFPATLVPEGHPVLRDYEAAWGARDADALAELFTEDGFVLRPGNPPAEGRDAIREAYRGSGGPLVLRAYDFAAEGDVGWIIGGYAPDASWAEMGKFNLALRRVDGRWLIAADIDNGN